MHEELKQAYKNLAVKWKEREIDAHRLHAKYEKAAEEMEDDNKQS